MDRGGSATANGRAGASRVAARCAAAGICGLVLFASFPPRTLWWLAPLAFAGFAAVVHGRSAAAGFGYGMLFGLGFFLPLLVWTGEFVGSPPWLALSTVEAVFAGLAGALIAVVSRLPGWPWWSAAAWVAAEAARARVPFGGFPWGKVAFGQPDGIFLPLAAVGGTPLVTFAVALTGFGLAALLHARSRLALRGPALAVLIPALAALAAVPLVDRSGGATATAAVVQGNVPRAGLDFNAQRRAVLDNHARRTEQLGADVRTGRVPQPDFVIWPENSSDIDPYRNADAYAVIDRAVRSVDVPVSVGAVLIPPSGPLRNTQILWEPQRGPVDEYDKRQTQPFGEYIPLRPLVELVNSDVDRVQREFGRGDTPGVFGMPGAAVGLVTCYEAAFDWAVRDTVRAGAQIIAVPSNNATFGFTEMTYQQLAMSRLRAVEHNRTVLVPVTSGVSAVILPDGTIDQRTELFQPDALVTEVPVRSGRTLATRLGTAPEWLLVGLAALGLGLAIVRRRIRPVWANSDVRLQPIRRRETRKR